jgi:DNA invertase Pin-like site-specific DNA recombinase
LRPVRRAGCETRSRAAGRWPIRISGLAEFERDRLSERIRDVKMGQRKRGLHLGGHRPFGYRVDADRRLVPDPKEQSAIAPIKELRQIGLSLRAIARRVHDDLGVTVQL